MQVGTVKFDVIDRPDIYGYEANNGRYDIEIIRLYASEWHVFVKENGRILPINHYAFHTDELRDIYRAPHLSFNKAKSAALKLYRKLSSDSPNK